MSGVQEELKREIIYKMEKKWKRVYFYCDDPYRGDPFNNPRIEGEMPACLSKREEFTVSHRPDDVFAFCDPSCRKHLYWYNWQYFPYDDVPTIIVEVYEKQTGRIGVIDKYIALEEILDEKLEEFEALFHKAEEAAKGAGLLL